MKYISPLIALALTCCNTAEQSFEELIPGIYVRPVASEYSIGTDTLEILAASEDRRNYYIHRRCSYRRVVRGKLSPTKRKTEKWVAIYRPEQKTLNEITKGKVLSFVPEKNLLLVGKAEYKKIK
ncbi:hypothetical protein EXU57_24180 [Segetibacter sp. 3557_3]|uniref:hypothetical protein n=1 Tax=Segetibacter sp. 3557_3 TaxID=2547429 RepID=UPI001058DC31|nr:hypothetical protein [Segetibacter sp. 3557_3]TDH18152.1 hypothetical protein EXU57_24180 [Segetibacter sp. 3557_3]